MASPILSRPDAFTRSPEYRQNMQQGPYGQAQGQPLPGGYGQYRPAGDVMTLDDVVAKTAITMALLVASAVMAWTIVPDRMVGWVTIGASVVGMVTAFLVTFRQKIPVGGVLFYAAVEGVFIGMISKFFEVRYPGIVSAAVIATFVTAGITLAAYKFFNIRVTPKFRKVIWIATAGIAVTYLVNFVLALVGVNTGLREIGSQAGWLSMAVSAVAVVVAVMSLVSDFDQIERGIAVGAPSNESWRAAFGVTVTMVWLYIEILRIVSYIKE